MDDWHRDIGDLRSIIFWRKMLKKILALLTIIALIVIFMYKDLYTRVTVLGTLFSGEEQYENLNRFYKFIDSSTLSPSSNPLNFKSSKTISLPSSFNYNDAVIGTEDFLQRTDTSALLILQNGRIQFEKYWLTGGENVQWMSMSVAKSFISALVGIAIRDGHINNIEEAISDYVPELKNSPYNNVRIKDVLQMSSGASWNEDYSDPESDINRWAKIFALGGSFDEFIQTLSDDFKPGTRNRYNSMDTQALGMLVNRATGKTITNYMTEMLWHPMGASNEGYWLLDSEGMEMAFAGLNITARDYAKFGELYRLDGKLNGQQIVPKSWVKDSITPDGPHLTPGDNPLSDYPLGYGYQWWVPEGDKGEFMAIGIYNQMIYVAPESNMVIVKLSANSSYGTAEDTGIASELETIEFFRAISIK
ncbi:beta-lactamase family protein [SAR86 cluster bacterium]|nr:beta-lactamase family protein [SAR86 cluster bacterium]